MIGICSSAILPITPMNIMVRMPLSVFAAVGV
jgi:hypothetical protein